jgi:hypothetical protein
MIIRVVLACHNASGAPDFTFVQVKCTPDAVAEGEHYETAKNWALAMDYEGPFVCFDENDGPAWLFQHFIWDKADTVPYRS